jgi:Holliday junction resolvase RusA-like endonuclease
MLYFTIPGEARGKGRPRATARGGFARLYADPRTAGYENLVALAAREALAGRAPLDEPLHMHVSVRLVPPASTSRKAREAMLRGEVHPGKRPDLDNVVKAVLDGCNAVAFRDDCLIVSLSAVKRYDAEAGVDVGIRPAGAP